MSFSNNTSNLLHLNPTVAPTSFKLDGTNYLGWQSQFLPFLKSNDLLGFVEGSEPVPEKTTADGTTNAAYTVWYKKDQALLGLILSSISPNLVASFYGQNTSKQVWNALKMKFSNQSRSRIAHMRRQLQTITQGSNNCSTYLEDAKSIADQLAAAGKIIDDQDLISFILGGLNQEYNPFITSFNFISRDNEFTFEDFSAELLSHESLLETQRSTMVPNTTFAFAANKKSPFTAKKKSYIPSNRSGGPQQRNSYPNALLGQPAVARHNSNQTTTRPVCQICDRTGHIAIDCYHRFDYAFQGRHPPTELAAMVAESHTQYDHQVWYTDSGANVHITSNDQHLTQKLPYHQGETVTVGNGAGLVIKSTGSTSLQINKTNFHLSNILHCPHASSNLLSINKFCLDNNCYFVLTSHDFTVKENQTDQTLLHGQVDNGLFPINGGFGLPHRIQGLAAKIGERTTAEQWHSRLGHPSQAVLQSLARSNHISLSSKDNKTTNNTSFCSTCPLGKSKKLPFPNSTHQSNSPLSLVHSDVWTSPVSSISGCRYYVLFVDDFSRYSWIYPLHNKSEVFAIFLKFKVHAENLFSCSIKQFQSDNRVGGIFISSI
jgi:histone deacetylase 1/2